MNAELSNAAARILADMAEALGTTTARLWPILVRQSILEGVRGAVLFVIGAVLLAWLLRWIPKRTPDKWGEPTFTTCLVAAIGGILGAVCLICGFIDAWQLLNPEFYAAQKILDAIGGTK